MHDSTSKRHIGKPIRKKLVTDEDHRPVAVQIDYEDWLDIEQRLGLEVAEPVSEDQPMPANAMRPHWQGSDEDFERLLNDTKNLWPDADGLDYQRRLRAEWDRPWDPD